MGKKSHEPPSHFFSCTPPSGSAPHFWNPGFNWTLTKTVRYKIVSTPTQATLIHGYQSDTFHSDLSLEATLKKTKIVVLSRKMRQPQLWRRANEEAFTKSKGIKLTDVSFQIVANIADTSSIHFHFCKHSVSRPIPHMRVTSDTHLKVHTEDWTKSNNNI